MKKKFAHNFLFESLSNLMVELIPLAERIEINELILLGLHRIENQFKKIPRQLCCDVVHSC